MKQDVYQKVRDKIIADAEQGELTWLKPWSAGSMDVRIINRLLKKSALDRTRGT
jgi:antirestriction protein ArdC